MTAIGTILLAVGIGVALYAYVGYPLLLALLGGLRRRGASGDARSDAPAVTVTIPAYNEERAVADAIEGVLAQEYPADRLHVVVISDASTDRTDEIVLGYADRNVELLRQPRRAGKTAAENASRQRVRGEIVVNTDASIRLHPRALAALVRAFHDPTVGVASGRDVSMSRLEREQNQGESGYVGYEMWIRDLETRLSGIVGASGCLFAIRADLHQTPVPEALSRDFASALIARERGFRAVSVKDALCYVPRTGSLRREYRRKVRTMTRGMETLIHWRHLLNPFRWGGFAWMLCSHKVCRWLVPWAGAMALVGLAMLATQLAWARWVLLAAVAGIALGAIGWLWPERRRMPRVVSLPAFALSANVAALVSSIKALRGQGSPVWEPTRREAVQ